MSRRSVQTVEQTGKRYKGQMLLSGLGLIAGLVVAFIGMSTDNYQQLLWGGLGALFCVLWLLLVKILAWWHHG